MQNVHFQSATPIDRHVPTPVNGFDTTPSPLLGQGNETAEHFRSSCLKSEKNTIETTRHGDTPTESLLRHETPTRTILEWPTSPKPVTTPRYISVLNGVFDILLLASSVAFLTFALVVAMHDQNSTAEYPRLTRTLVNATKYGPTVSPILYASIVGRATHAILLWRLERGERIGILDMLASSTSLTSTVTSQLQLRSLSVLGLALLAVWSLSPIGGQASVRIMTAGFKDTEVRDSFKYMVNSGLLGSYTPADMHQQGTISAGTTFVAALMASPAIKTSPLDLWGNVKIPRIEDLESAMTTDADGWYNVHGRDVDFYSSPIGVPVAGLHDTMYVNYLMRIQSPYLHLDCSYNATDTEGPFNSKLALPDMLASVSGQGSIFSWNAPNGQNRTNSSLSDRDDVLPEDASPLSIRYVPIYGRAQFTLTCNVTQTYVEAEIQCPTASTCAAKRVRRSRLDHYPSAWTLLDLSWRTLPLFFESLLKNFQGKLFYPQLLDQYLGDPNLVSPNYANVTKATPEKYALRLAQILNANFACLNGPFAITAGVNNETAYFRDDNQTFKLQPEGGNSSIWSRQYESTYGADMFKSKAWSTNGTKTERIEVIVAHRGWVVALCIASAVLILSSLVSPFTHHFLSVGVDVAMNISSLATRDNPYMALPQTGTYLDASDRARLLCDHMVRFGDTEGASETGMLVIGSISEGGGSTIARVRKGKLYE